MGTISSGEAMIKALLTDLDNTLYEFDKCNTPALQEVIKSAMEKLDSDEQSVRRAYEEGRAKVKELLPRVAAGHSRLLYIQSMVERLSNSTQPQLVLDLYNLYHLVYAANMELRSGAKRMIEAAKSNRLKICTISDYTAEVHMTRLERLRIAQYVDYVVTSEEAGVEKPDTRIFSVALQKLGCKTDECIYVGDDHKRDIVGATLAGIRAFHVKEDADFNMVIEAIK